MNIYDISEKYESMKRSAVKHTEMRVTDNTMLEIEDCTGVELFDENTIKLHTGYGSAEITGLDLKMSNFSGRGVKITGKIHSVTFGEEDRKDKK